MAQQPRKRKKPASTKSKPTKATSTRKPARAKSKGSKKSRQGKWGYRSLLLKIGLIGLLLVAVGIIYLDAKITTHFEGKRWAIPAKVYARPLELYDGVQLSEAQLRFELDLLNYRRAYNNKQDPGTYQFQGDSFQISTRGFESWEGPEPARHLSLTLSQGRLQDLTGDGKPVTIARLEPAMIGGIYPADNQDRVLVKLNQVPPLLVKGLVAVEDRGFYHNIGISFRGIARALWVDITTGSLREGGSTLTQQLVKNFYLSSKRTLSRKAIEAVMAVLLECHYSKNEILQAYLNEVYLGQAGKRGIYGFGLGSLFYFGQPVWELKTSQIALLVGLVRGPSWYDPRRNPERALARRNQVLQEMLSQGVLDQAEYNKAVRKPLGIIDKPQYEESRYPAFMDLVKRQLRHDYKDSDLRSEGLRVYTTLDPWAQHQLEQSIETQTDLLQKRYGKPLTNLEAAGVITATNTGEVVAVVGGRSYRFEGFNRALDANRQIGSLAKPAVYLAALEHGYTLASLVHDESFQLRLPNGSLWSPENFERKSHGDVPAIVALANSYNQATARLALDVGLGNVVDVMHRLGITEDLPEVPSLALGSVSLSPFEVAQMYQTIASEGFNTPLRSVRSVLTSDGHQLQRYELKVQQRFSAADIYMLVDGMQEVVREGTGKSANQYMSPDFNLAGKTGTSNEQRDSWFAGFSGNYLGVVWMGLDDNGPTPLTGAGGALRVWNQTFSHLPLQPLELNQPPDVEWVWVDPLEQAQTGSYCDHAIRVPMRKESVPQKTVSCSPGGRVFNWFRSLMNSN